MPKSAGYKNLKPVTSKEEAKERGRAGGIKSGEARKEKKLFKEAIEKQLGDSLDNIVKAMIKKASNGDISASVFLRDTIGEKPTDKVEGNISVEKLEDLL